jgi:hypothetical protein
MSARPVESVPRQAVIISRWLLILFAGSVLVFVAATAYHVWDAEEPLDVLWTLVLLPWIAGPAVIPTMLVAWARSRAEAWSLVGIEAAVVISAVALWAVLIVIKPDAQNGIALLAFPLIQFALLPALVLGVRALVRTPSVEA